MTGDGQLFPFGAETFGGPLARGPVTKRLPTRVTVRVGRPRIAASDIPLRRRAIAAADTVVRRR